MKTVDTYYIKRDNAYIWASPDFDILPSDEIIEVRPMLFADEGKTLFNGNIEIGQAVWLQDEESIVNYIEQDIILPEDITDNTEDYE